jgi:hypothetical protein
MCLTLFLPGCQEHRSEGTEMPDNDGERRGMTLSAEPIGSRTIIQGELSVSTPRQRRCSHVFYGLVLVQAVHVTRRNQHATSTHPRSAGSGSLTGPARRHGHGGDADLDGGAQRQPVRHDP